MEMATLSILIDFFAYKAVKRHYTNKETRD
jgi:hypothetical protein